MKKKLLSVLLASAMTMALLAGCGSTDAGTAAPADSSSDTAAATTTTDSGAGDAAAADTTTASGDAVTINVYRCSFNVANPDTDQVKKVQDAINAYIADKINVQINLPDVGSGEYTEKANLALQSGEINLLWTASWEGTIGTNDLVPQNAVYDLTDLSVYIRIKIVISKS